MFVCIPVLTWGWACVAEDSVSAELSSTGTIVETPVEWKVNILIQFNSIQITQIVPEEELKGTKSST